MSVLHVVSVSGGKDSTATLCYALQTQPRETVRAVFADTGNEHEMVYQYLDYLEDALELKIARLRRDFTTEWDHRREWLKSDAPRTDRKDRKAYTEEQIATVLTIFEQPPTGNPYLDLCIIKGRFPARKAQFCTQFLKTEPLIEYQMALIDNGECDVVHSWQGIRRDEGGRRAFAKEFEEVGGGLYIARPIVRWKAKDCFEAMAACGIKPNPLYLLGFDRVGCMPCINSNKADIMNMAKRFPKEVARLMEWETAVAKSSWRGASSFFPAPNDGRADRVGRNITQVVQWSRTSRGARNIDLLADLPVEACSSSYGLCE